MAKVSIIGAGTAGCIFAYALLKSGKGYEVTMYSDRTPDQWLNDVAPTGTAALYPETIDVERALGMDHWSQDMHEMHGVLLDFKPTIDGEQRLEVAGRFGERAGGAIDMRMRVHRWLNDFEDLGGKLVIESVSAARADEIAAGSDLTVLAAGKGELSRLIEKDPQRCVYDKPQRKVIMYIVEGMENDRWDDRADFNPVKFNFYGDTGEYFWVPFTHKTAGSTWCCLFEPKHGGKMDIFDDVTTAQEAVDRGNSFIKEHAPWEWDIVRHGKPIEDDPFCWLKGQFPPSVRKAYGMLPCGKPIMPLGDTAITFDPIGGQGGNCAQRNAKFIADMVIGRGDLPFDGYWMQQVMDAFWAWHGEAAYTFNNILLEPLTQAGQIMLGAASNNRQFADEHFIGNFTKPKQFFPYMTDVEAAMSVAGPYLPQQAAE
ncbi:MAG: styrene monooxygenase/indole monooxygenase family protein [Pseudomonadota bacterium]